jgi:transposase
MSETRMPEPATALDHESTIVAVVELSARSWLVGAQVAGVPRQCRQKLAPSAEGLLDHLDQLRQRAEKAGKRVSRVVVAYEAGRDGFWLARWLLGRGIEVYVIQPSSVPVDRRARRAKTDALDVEMLLRTTLAWLRGEPRVCSMVPIPSEVEEDGRRPLRERQDLIKARLALTNKIDGVLATLGVGG